jgi:hypothetical protein
METHSTSPGWAGAHSRVMVRRPTANEPATVISTSTARPMPTGVVRQSGCRSCGDCDKASGPTPPHRCPARGTGARHPGRAGARPSRPAAVRAGRSALGLPPNPSADPTPPPGQLALADTDSAICRRRVAARLDVHDRTGRAHIRFPRTLRIRGKRTERERRTTLPLPQRTGELALLHRRLGRGCGPRWGRWRRHLVP